MGQRPRRESLPSIRSIPPNHWASVSDARIVYPLSTHRVSTKGGAGESLPLEPFLRRQRIGGGTAWRGRPGASDLVTQKISSPQRLAPETEVLLLCARSRLNDTAQRRLRELLDAPVDWDTVRSLANKHHTSALLFHHLATVAPEKVPAQFLVELQSYYFHLAARNLRVVGQAISILERLESVGAPGVIWKGPALAYTVYRSPELRTFTDIDILVRRRDLPHVRQTLEASGFFPRRREGVTADELFERPGEVVSMWNEGVGVGVDVHWGSTGRYLSPVMDCEQLWRRSVSLDVAGSSIRALQPAWMVLALCAHGAKHGPYPWPALKWVTDIDALVRAHPPEWWSSVLSLSREVGAHRMLLVGLALAAELLDAPLPAEAQSAVEACPAVDELLIPILHRILQREPAYFPFSERLRFDLMVRERRRDRVGWVVAKVLTPGTQDLVETPASRGFLRIPKRLVRLGRQYLLRPSRGKTFLFGADDTSDTSDR
jgi:hypothetical protein